MPKNIPARVFAGADRVELAIVRAMLMTDTVEVLDRLSVLAETRRRLDRRIEREVAAALEVGESCGKIGRRLGVSRQAVHRRWVARARPARPSEGVDTQEPDSPPAGP